MIQEMEDAADWLSTIHGEELMQVRGKGKCRKYVTE